LLNRRLPFLQYFFFSFFYTPRLPLKSQLFLRFFIHHFSVFLLFHFLLPPTLPPVFRHSFTFFHFNVFQLSSSFTNHFQLHFDAFSLDDGYLLSQYKATYKAPHAFFFSPKRRRFFFLNRITRPSAPFSNLQSIFRLILNKTSRRLRHPLLLSKKQRYFFQNSVSSFQTLFQSKEALLPIPFKPELWAIARLHFKKFRSRLFRPLLFLLFLYKRDRSFLHLKKNLPSFFLPYPTSTFFKSFLPFSRFLPLLRRYLQDLASLRGTLSSLATFFIFTF
jgi:hypothetical protein